MFNSKRIAELEKKIQDMDDSFADAMREVQKALQKLEDKKRDKVKPGEAGPTMGTYNHIDEVNPRVAAKPKGRVITPKTPQQVEFETQEKIKKMNEPVRTVPR